MVCGLPGIIIFVIYLGICECYKYSDKFITYPEIKMRLIKQPVTLEINNLNVEGTHKNHIKHSVLLPNTIRCIVCGPSNCGKTNIMLSLLLHKNGLKFKNVYLYSKTTFQPKYCFLSNVFKCVPGVKFFIFKEDKDVISPSHALKNSVFIFDDVACENQVNIRNYFSMGRHKQIDCFYLSQTYSKIPKQLIRDNANLLIIFRQDDINLKHIYNEHVNTDMNYVQFKKLCSDIWKEPYSFLIINKDCALNEGRYRKYFDVFVTF